jgi:F420-non-reducing hydrogenase iron-sulfur subunit
MLQENGINPERFAIEWVSSAEAPRFAEVVTRFTQKIRLLGPSSTKPELSLTEQLSALAN